MSQDLEVSLFPFSFKYLPMLLDMHKDREYAGIAYLNMKVLPKIGYIALIGKHPVAAGFLRRVEGGFGQIDCLVSSPHFGSQARHVALSKVLNALIQDGKDLKLHGIIGFTADTGCISRAAVLGFREIDQRVIGLSLTRGV